MRHFLGSLHPGDIQLRDNWQFELKSEVFPLKGKKKQCFVQEFYLFIPNALRINPHTYSKSQFYNDQSCFIRHKTPQMEISSAIDLANPISPLYQFELHRKSGDLIEAEKSLKLFGNIIRSALRVRIASIVSLIHHQQNIEQEIGLLKEELHLLNEVLEAFKKNLSDEARLLICLDYVHQFINNVTSYYLVGCLDVLRHVHRSDELSDQLLTDLLKGYETVDEEMSEQESEKVLYRRSLLNKYVLDALLLSINRFSIKQKWGDIIASLAAFIAMFIFLIFFTWQSKYVVVNSAAFILITSTLYIVKDRLKEWLKQFALAYRSISDFTTEIKTPDERYTIGKQKDFFSFIKQEQMDKEIASIRNSEFHEVLDQFQRPEHIIYYKNQVELNPMIDDEGLNLVFRLNIHSFIAKAGNSSRAFMTLDRQTGGILMRPLPKVYHINIVLKNRYFESDQTEKTEIKKFRLVVDGNGIKRVQQVAL